LTKLSIVRNVMYASSESHAVRTRTTPYRRSGAASAMLAKRVERSRAAPRAAGPRSACCCLPRLLDFRAIGGLLTYRMRVYGSRSATRCARCEPVGAVLGAMRAAADTCAMAGAGGGSGRG